MCRRYHGRPPVQKNQSSVVRGRTVMSGAKARQVMETRDKLRVVKPQPTNQPTVKRIDLYNPSDHSSDFSGSDSDDSSDESSKETSDTNSESSSDKSTGSETTSTSSSSNESADEWNSSNSTNKSKSEHSGLTESEILSDTDSSFSSSEEEEEKNNDNPRHMQRSEMNSNNASKVQVIDGSERTATGKTKTRSWLQDRGSSVESDPGFARYMSVFHERWKSHGEPSKGPCVHANRSTIASAVKLAKRESVGEKHGQACKNKPVNAAAIFNERQQALYGDPGTFQCDHADKKDEEMMMQAICDDMQSNKMIHDLIEKQVRKAKRGGGRYNNPRC